MFGKLFGKKNKKNGEPSASSENLVFNSAADAIEYSSKYMNCDLREGHALPAIVVAEGGFEGGETRDEQGFQILQLQMPTDNGRLNVVGISGCAGTKIANGDFVEWVLVDHEPLSGIYGGVVISRLRPELKQGVWQVAEEFEYKTPFDQYGKNHFEYHYAMTKGLFNKFRGE